MKIQQAKRMSIFEPSIFSRLREVTEKRKKDGGSVIDLSLGSPDLPPASFVRERLSKTSADSSRYGYTMSGTARFYEAVARYYKRRDGVELDPETEILQTMGSQEGLVHLPLAFCDEGDIVLTTNPAYVAYDVGIRLAGAEPYDMPLLKEHQFLPQFEAIPEEIAKRAKLMILNLPGNPVPATPTKEFFEAAVAFAKKYHILILHDAAYSEFYYTDEPFPSFLATEGAKEVGLETNSLSKSFSLAGARIAYFVGNREAIRILKELKSNLDYGVFEPIQEAAVSALDRAEEITVPLREVFKERHHVLKEGLEQLGWDVADSEGGMFVWAKYPFELDDEIFAIQAIEKVGVVMVPGSSFGSEGKGYVRIALVQPVEKLREAVQRLTKLK